MAQRTTGKKIGDKKRPKPATARQVAGRWKHRYQTFSLPTFRSPLEGQGEVRFRDEVDHAFFLRCCELYRVLDLLERTTEQLIETYSKYRSRTQFTETLNFRYFDSEEALVALFEPQLAGRMFFLFNFLYELRISLTYTDDLPLTVKQSIDDSMLTLREAWNELVDGVRDQYGWQFKKLAALGADSPL
jgi:hypothetical protein